MGFFSFIKDVGDKIFGKANAAEASAEDIKKDLDNLGLDTKDLQVKLEGDKVVLSGTAKDQETLEKAILEVGNKMGVAGVSTDGVKVETAQTESKFYTVKKGDTLSAISKACYGDANKYMVIFEANKPMLTHPDKIYPGQQLRIPPLK